MRTFFEWTATDDPGKVIDVQAAGGWDEIRQTYAGSTTSRQLDRVIAIGQGHGVRTVLVEFRYIDLDYRSEHSSFYGTTFRRYPSVCHRLHFFSEKVSVDLSNLGSLQDAYRGYSVMRPLPQSPVGRTMVPPPKELEEATVCLATDTVHLFGYSFNVVAMPFISQDAQYLRCAHAAQWMTLQFAHLVLGMPRRLPADVHTASLGGVVVGRQVPSEGLSSYQMLVGLQALGLSPSLTRLPLDRAASKAAGQFGLFPILCRYVNSAMPPIVVSDQHAWVVTVQVPAGWGGIQGPVVKSCRRASSRLLPCLPAVWR